MGKPNKKSPKRPPPPSDPDIGKIVWVKCRASRPCGGNEAKIVMKFKLQTGGTSIRYRCQNCRGSFHTTL